MSKHTFNISESDMRSIKSLFKQMDKDLQSLQQVIEEKKERDYHLEIIEEKLKLVKEIDEYIRKT